jgi:hypothetical protein
MSGLITQLVNVGLSPNDGSGNTIRDAFIKQNENLTALTDFLLRGGAKLPQLVIEGNLITYTLDSETGTFSNTLKITSDFPSTTSNTGSFVVTGGVGIGGNLNVNGTINGDIQSSLIVADAVHVLSGQQIDGLLTTNNVNVAGNLQIDKNVSIVGNLSVFGNVTTVTTSELIINDPIIEIGGVNDMNLSSPDGRNRGLQFYWYDTTANVEQKGFFGFDNAHERFTFTSRESDSIGNALFDQVEANIISSGTSIFNVIDANIITVTSGITGTLLTNAQPNITSVGTLQNLSMDGNTTINGVLQINNGGINIVGTGSLYVNGDPVQTASQAFHGGLVPLITMFTDETESTSIDTGAVVVGNVITGKGGLGVIGNANIGGTITALEFTANSFSGTLMTADQPNITTVGILGNLDVENKITTTSLSANNITVATFVNANQLGGTLTTAEQPNITTVGTLGNLTVSGDVIANSFTGIFNGAITGNLSGDITGSADTVRNSTQHSITEVGTLNYLNVTGNTVVSTLKTTSITANSNIETTSSVVGSNLFGTIRTPSQPNITTIGQLTGLTVNGSTTLINNVTFNNALIATGSGTQNIGSLSNRFGTIYSTSLNSSGNILTNGTFEGVIGAITPFSGNFTTIGASGNVTLQYGSQLVFPDGSTQSTAYQAYTLPIASASTLGGIKVGTGLSIDETGTVIATGLQTLPIASASTLGAVKIGSGITVSNGTISVSSITSGMITSALGYTPYNSTNPSNYITSSGAPVQSVAGKTGNITLTAADVGLGNITNSAQLTTSQTLSLTGDVTANATLLSNGSMSTTLSTITDSGIGTFKKVTVNNKGLVTGTQSVGVSDITTALGYTPYNASNPNNYISNAVTTLTSGGHITASAITGAVTLGSDATSTNTINTIVARDNNGNFSANIINATATKALYADLAEMYSSDGEYEPSTVLVFGGNYEVTVTGHMADVAVAGVVSTNPGFLMNNEEQHAVPVALRGKVPTKVIGPVRKGDLLVTSTVAGYAVSVGKDSKYGVAVFAKSLDEDLEPGQKVINAVII